MLSRGYLALRTDGWCYVCYVRTDRVRMYSGVLGVFMGSSYSTTTTTATTTTTTGLTAYFFKAFQGLRKKRVFCLHRYVHTDIDR